MDTSNFDKAKNPYEKALKESGHEAHLKYSRIELRSTADAKKKNRERNIIWFNPPYNAGVKTNIGREFLQILDKHFPKRHKLSKIFNRKNVKLSYSCMQNMGSIIASHNKQILKKGTSKKTNDCNCQKGVAQCPLRGNCREETVVYKA